MLLYRASLTGKVHFCAEPRSELVYNVRRRLVLLTRCRSHGESLLLNERTVQKSIQALLLGLLTVAGYESCKYHCRMRAKQCTQTMPWHGGFPQSCIRRMEERAEVVQYPKSVPLWEAARDGSSIYQKQQPELGMVATIPPPQEICNDTYSPQTTKRQDGLQGKRKAAYATIHATDIKGPTYNGAKTPVLLLGWRDHHWGTSACLPFLPLHKVKASGTIGTSLKPREKQRSIAAGFCAPSWVAVQRKTPDQQLNQGKGCICIGELPCPPALDGALMLAAICDDDWVSLPLYARFQYVVCLRRFTKQKQQLVLGLA